MLFYLCELSKIAANLFVQRVSNPRRSAGNFVANASEFVDSKLFFVNSRDEFIKQKIRVERTAACFGMKLHAERGNVRVLDSFASAVVCVYKTQIRAARQTFVVNGVAVILA